MLTKLDLFLASHIAQQPGGESFLANVGVDRQVADSVRRIAHSSVFRRVESVRVDAVKEFFGPPEDEDYSRLEYKLTYLPEHRFVFGLQDGELIVDEHISLRNNAALPRKILGSLSAVREVLRSYVHTSEEVETLLGVPDEEKSWYPAQTWYYRREDPEGSLGLTFCFGLLTSIDSPELVPTMGGGAA